jgi:DNA-binding MarR family transcriptional regulator
MTEPNATTRRVWAYLSQPEHTQDTIREIAAALNLGTATVSKRVRWLHTQGYIESERYSHRARRVVVPLVVRRKHAK